MRVRLGRHRGLVGLTVVLVVLVGALRASGVAFERSCEEVPEPGAYS
jgi:hypothetical protein